MLEKSLGLTHVISLNLAMSHGSSESINLLNK